LTLSFTNAFSAGMCAFEYERLVLGRVARINCYDGTCNIPGIVAQQEFDGVRDVIYFGQAVKRAAARDLLALRSAKTLGHLCSEKAWCDSIDVDAQGTDFSRKGLRKADDRRFSGAIYGKAAVAGEADDRSDVDDTSATIRHHRANDVLGEDDWRDSVQVDEPLDLGIVHSGQDAAGAEPGVVDKTMYRPELLA